MQKIDFSPLSNKPQQWKKVSYLELGTIGAVLFIGIRFVFSIGFSGAFLWFLGAFVLFAVWYYIASRDSVRVRNSTHLDFAKRNGFSYGQPVSGIAYRSLMYTQGLDAAQISFVTGRRNDLPFRMFIHTYLTNADKESSRVDIQVLEIELGKLFPHLFIDSRLNDEGMEREIRKTFKHSQKLQLEGNFNDYFDVYIPKEYEIEGLDVISTDLMSLLLDHGESLDLEVMNKRLYIYLPRLDSMSDYAVYKTMFTFFDKVAGLLQAKVDVWQFTEIPKTSYRLLDSYKSDIKRANIIANVAAYIVWALIILFVLSFAAMFYFLFTSID